MRKDKVSRHQSLCDLIQASDPSLLQERYGEVWVIRPLHEWAEALGTSTKTISRLSGIPPIWSLRCQAVDEDTGRRVQAVALRVGDPPKRTPELVAGIMSRMFRRRFNVDRITRRDFGCLIGLAEVWPAGHQEKIFADALTNWPDTAKAIKLDADYMDPPEGRVDRYWAWPCISLMRRFPAAVSDAYLTRLQASGHPVPFQYSVTGQAA